MTYSDDQLLMVWSSVRFNQSRYWAFVLENGTWRHTDKNTGSKVFNNFDAFRNYVKQNGVVEIHVKQTIDNGREWVIDVDHKDTDPRIVELKNMISHATFEKFFGENCVRIMFSGNRGLHIWLDHNQFDYRACKNVREYYYDTVLKPPDVIIREFVNKGSLHDCFLRSFENEWIVRTICTLFPNIKMDDTSALIKNFYPNVDRQVFVTLKQIRAPYSFHPKSKRFNCIHKLCDN
ncbi:late expression factor 1 [Phthorimaea operculella granulovirus]|uniref:Late expression factor 1 n=1 Tax=Phthorimaea operculella granulovirus TaxID=192584 RepID=Q8JRZ3_9BBAC|nr:late expression factor 1 [Phthorimaea operculella granulovirus]AAM70264.1 late expression factor 1 [Phthorimaea operculella granulovirus]QBH65901.1 late expression factor 1 [Phthorimaea operculella granulovirus]QBH66031.1 late expression factor 1 [Phthorimaea operculella granulovirus]QBH66161.1 late expression factor 1 [Phthorimaea operculella granulovirus]QBH66291.1 late expression factor 1 [Phthorimaea operculella granulovirus]